MKTLAKGIAILALLLFLLAGFATLISTCTGGKLQPPYPTQ